jgi:hypothetical protein
LKRELEKLEYSKGASSTGVRGAAAEKEKKQPDSERNEMEGM